MKNQHETLWVFSCLPALPYVMNVPKGFAVAGLICAAWWGTALFFRATAFLFPARLFQFAIVLWLTAWAGIAAIFFQLSPFWAISVFLLGMKEFQNEENINDLSIREIIVRGLKSLYGLSILVMIQGGAGTFRGLEGLQSPPISFLILGMFVLIEKNFLTAKKTYERT